jgi:hypothetical protein
MTTASLSQNERRLELALAIAASLGGLAVLLVGSSYGLTNTTGVGAGFMPAVAGILLAVSGLVWVGQLVRTARQPEHPADATNLVDLIAEDVGDESEVHSFPDRSGWARVGILAGSIAAAALLLPVLGYSLTMVALLCVILIVLARRRVWLAILVAVAVSLISRLVFEVWLGTSLPHSMIPVLSWLGI